MPSDFVDLPSLLSSYLPSESFSGVLRQELWSRSGCFDDESIVRMKAFLCASFKPVVAGSLAASHNASIAVGNSSPQFSLISFKPKNIFQCEVCGPFQNWQKTVNISKYFRKTDAKLEGFRQVYEHYISNNHKQSMEWWEFHMTRTMLLVVLWKTHQTHVLQIS